MQTKFINRNEPIRLYGSYCDAYYAAKCVT